MSHFSFDLPAYNDTSIFVCMFIARFNMIVA